MLAINVMRRKYRKVKWPAVARSQTQDMHLWLEPPVQDLPPSHNSRTTTNPHNPPYMYCTGGTECLSRTPGSHSVAMYRQNSGRGWPENSLLYEGTHAECFSHSKCSEHLACLTLETNGFRCYEAKIEENEKAGSHWESTQDTSGLSRQCSICHSQSHTLLLPHNI